MSKLIVLSPHLDDAVFSLALSLCRWKHLSFKVEVINYFTQSSYGPYAADLASTVSHQRKREDRRALSMINQDIRVRSAGLFDAPLRLQIPVASVCDTDASSVREQDVELLSREINLLGCSSAVIAPLGLGNHVDHLTVAAAAIRSRPPSRLAFYEDLPYATWTPETAILQRVRETSIRTRVPLRPLIVRGPCNMRVKRRLASQYRTQITSSEAASIAAFAAKYRAGERIWIPRHSAIWNSFI